jgi:hypothetical protein
MISRTSSPCTSHNRFVATVSATSCGRDMDVKAATSAAAAASSAPSSSPRLRFAMQPLPVASAAPPKVVAVCHLAALAAAALLVNPEPNDISDASGVAARLPKA